MEKFKGWTKPGPLLKSPEDLEAGETLDAISGTYRLYQYKDGHRFSTDDLLVAWFGTTHGIRAERVLDLGSGIGTVASIVAWRLPGARITTVEAQSRSVRLARKSVKYNELSGRYEIREGDFREPSVFREGETFDLVFGSPPYFPLSDGILAEHPQKVECRFEARGDVGDYCRAAAPRIAPGGMLFLVFPFNQEARVLDAARSAGLRVLRSQEVIFKEGEGSFLALYQLMKEGDLPEAYWKKLPPHGYREPAITVRLKNGEIDPGYSAMKLAIGFPP